MRKIKRFPTIDGDLGWFELSPGYKDILGERLKGEHHFDFCIIGAGFTGLSAAHRLAEIHKNAKIAVVEALAVGEGTSGRNAGFIIDIPHNVDGGAPNVENDKKLYALNRFAIERLRRFKNMSGDDCGWQDAGKYMTAADSRNLKHLDAFISQLKNAELAYEDLDAAETKKRLGTSYYQRSVYTSGTVLVNPAALIRAVAKTLPDNVTLFEKSPVIACDYADKVRVETVGGAITADFLIEATSVFNEQFGGIKNRTAAMYTYASLTRPLDDNELKAARLNHVAPWAVTAAHWTGTTVRYTQDKRIFIRNILEPAPYLHTSEALLQKAYLRHREFFECRFPELAQVDFQYTWGGMIGITLNQNSIMKKVRPNVLVLNGCNGVGVSKGTFLGYYAADFIDGKNSPELSFILENSHPSWMPPEPFRNIGATVRLKWEQRQGGLDI